MRALGTALALTLGLALSACGGPSDDDRGTAEDFCGSSGEFVLSGMAIDQYANPDGWDRCVEDAAEVASCLDRVIYSGSLEPRIPESC